MESRPLRILFVHNGADLYGASRSLLRLSCRLHRDGHAVQVVLPWDGPLVAEVKRAGVRAVIHPNLGMITRRIFQSSSALLGSMMRLLLSIFELWRIVRQFRPDVIHTNTALILAPGIVAKLARRPHVWHVRESFGEFPLLMRWFQWFMFWLSSRIVCVSESVAGQFERRIRRKIVVVHNGIPLDEFAPVSSQRVRAFREHYGLDGHRVVGVVGRIKLGRKGQDTFVQAASLLKQKFPKVRFVCIGSPFPGNDEHLRNLLQMVQDLGLQKQFVYTGDVEDIKAAYSALSISVLPSALPEPFGGVVIEAMAMGKAVVGTRIGGTVEQIDDGVTGFLVEPDNPRALAGAIERLLVDGAVCEQMGANGRRRYLERFEFEEFYRKMLGLYSTLVSRHRNA